MKQKAFLLVVAILVCSFTASATTVENIARKTVEKAMVYVVNSGYISQAHATEFLESGITEQCATTFISTGGDFKATVDKAAQMSVEKGWFKDEAAAKRAIKQAFDKARKSDKVAKIVCQTLGL